MNIYDIILKDALMEAPSNSANNPIIILDLERVRGSLDEIEDGYGVGVDNTLLINEMLPFLTRLHMVDQHVPSFLKAEMEAVNKEYKQFSVSMRMDKMRTMARTIGQIQRLAYGLRELFHDYGLYSTAGVLIVDTIDADHLGSAFAYEGKKWIKDFETPVTYSTSGTSLGYLGRILASH